MKMNHQQNPVWVNKIRRQFLLTFFEGNHYAEKKINGFFLIKQFSERLMDWEVAVYTKEAFQKKQNYKKRISQLLKPRGNKQERG